MIYDFHSGKIVDQVKYFQNTLEVQMDNEERYEMAYLAGAFDGDGSFSLCRKIENINRSPLYYPLIQFGCKDSILINSLKERFGGYVHIAKPHESKEGFQRKEFFRYKLEKRNVCTPFLEKIIPFLKIKKERAEAILTYIQENPFIRGSRKLDPQILFNRERSYQKIKKMNAERKINQNYRRKKLPPIEEDIFWPYIAGLMDTDGSFTINKNGFVPMMSISMVDIKSLEYLRGFLDIGNITVVKAKTCKLGFTYRWTTKAKGDVKYFLDNVIPFLRSKKENACVLREFIDKRISTLYCRGGIVQEQMDMRKFYHKKLCCLNKYGVYKPSLIDLEVQKPDDRAEGESHRERLNEMASES